MLFFGKCFQASEGKRGKDEVPDAICSRHGLLLRAAMAVTMGKRVRSGRKHGWLPISPVVWVDDVLIFAHGGEYAQHIVRTLEQELSGWRASFNDEAQWIALLRAGDSACVNQTMMPFFGNRARFGGSRCARAGTAPRGSGAVLTSGSAPATHGGASRP